MPESVSSWNDLTDKPFGTVERTITWDGNTEGLSSFDTYYKVSDDVPSVDILSSNKIVIGMMIDGEYVEEAISSLYINEMIEGMYVVYGSAIICFNDIYYSGNLIATAGVYFTGDDSFKTTFMSWDELHTIDAKYLPNNGHSDYTTIDTSNPAYIANKTHYNANYEIAWDGDTTNRVKEINAGELYKVSDITISEEVLKVSIAEFVNNGITETYNISDMSSDIRTGSSYIVLGSMIFIIMEDSCAVGSYYFPEKGIYFYKDSSAYISSLKSSYIKQLDESYIPDTIARINDIPAPDSMTGSTSTTAGASGLVPAPAAGSQDKFLKGDGTWGTLAPQKIALVATAGQTSFTIPFEYDSLSSNLTVYFNGILMKETDNYTVNTSNNTVNLVGFSAESGDIITIMGLLGAQSIDFGQEAIDAINKINKAVEEAKEEIDAKVTAAANSINTTAAEAEARINTLKQELPENWDDYIVAGSSITVDSGGYIAMDNNYSPTNNNYVTTKKYVDEAISTATSNIVTDVFHRGTSAPSNTKLLWIDTNSGNGNGLMKYYNGSSWVAISAIWS